MSAQCATCRLRGTNGLRQNVHREIFFGGKDVKSSGWCPLLPRNSQKLLTVRLCEDSRVMRAMLHFYIFILTRSIFFFFFPYNFCSAFLFPSLQWRRVLSGISVLFKLDVKPLFLDIWKKKLSPFCSLFENKNGDWWEKKNFYTMLWWRHQHRQRKGGAHLTLKGANGQARNWPVMIVMDARVCWPLARCISENDWGFWGL